MNVIDEHKLSRGDILIRFAAAEELMGYYIAEELTDNEEKRDLFINTVLAQPLLSFELKKNIFYQLLKRKGLYKGFPREEFEQMQKIRNKVAHGSVEYRDILMLEKEQNIKIGFAGKQYDLVELSNEFKRAESRLSPALLDVFFEGDG